MAPPLAAAQGRPRRSPGAIERYEPGITTQQRSSRRGLCDKDPGSEAHDAPSARKRQRQASKEQAAAPVEERDPEVKERAFTKFFTEQLEQLEQQPSEADAMLTDSWSADLQAMWNDLPDAERERRYDLAAAPSLVLRNPDMLMAIFQSITSLKPSPTGFPLRDDYRRERLQLRTYRACALVCKQWNSVLQGKDGSGETASALLRGLLSNGPTMRASTGRTQFCGALALSTARANDIWSALPRRMGGTHEGDPRVFPMPAAYVAAMEAYGGWADLVRRRAVKVRIDRLATCHGRLTPRVYLCVTPRVYLQYM